MNRIEEILNHRRNLLVVKQTLFGFNTPFNRGNTVENLELSHTHWVIWHLCRAIEGGKYGEIGSHCGRSAICAAASNPHLEINCFDSPNSGWGGADTESELNRALQTFAQNRHTVNIGDSHSDAIRSKIKELGPYDLMFVDGDHSAEGALKDLRTVYPNIVAGGFLVFDDIDHHPYLTDVWRKFVKETDPLESLEIHDLTEVEQQLNYVKRGIGILIK